MEQAKLEKLRKAARQIRIGVIDGTHAAKSGHPGGSLSIADIMAYLYFEEMNVDPTNPKMADRDRFVLSKGHCAPALYAAEKLCGGRSIHRHGNHHAGARRHAPGCAHPPRCGRHRRGGNRA